MIIRPSTVLCIAGSDNTGGAGIAADIRTVAAAGGYAAIAVTAITAQNGDGVKSIRYVGDDMLSDQLRATLRYMRPDAVKIGMVPNASAARIIADAIREFKLDRVVLDPVLGATCGGDLNEGRDEVIRALRKELLPLTYILTPNVPELFALAGAEEDSDRSEVNLEKVAKSLLRKFHPQAILVKGGHLDSDTCTDFLVRPRYKTRAFDLPRIKTRNTHGTGCTLSSALAAYGSLPIESAVMQAKRLTFDAIAKGARFTIFPSYGPVFQSCM